MSKRRVTSSFLVFLMFSSILIALVGPATPVMVDNETTSGTITTSETWSGTHQLTGDVSIAPGSKLIIPILREPITASIESIKVNVMSVTVT